MTCEECDKSAVCTLEEGQELTDSSVLHFSAARISGHFCNVILDTSITCSTRSELTAFTLFTADKAIETNAYATAEKRSTKSDAENSLQTIQRRTLGIALQLMTSQRMEPGRPVSIEGLYWVHHYQHRLPHLSERS